MYFDKFHDMLKDTSPLFFFNEPNEIWAHKKTVIKSVNTFIIVARNKK